LTHAQILPQQLVPAGREDLLDDLLRLLALGVGVLADELAQLLVRDLDPRLLGNRLEGELARDRTCRFGAQALLELLRRLVRDGEVGLRRDPAALERLGEPGEELARPCGDERPRRLAA